MATHQLTADAIRSVTAGVHQAAIDVLGPVAKPESVRRGLILTMMNGMMERKSNRKWRELLGRYIFGSWEAE